MARDPSSGESRPSGRPDPRGRALEEFARRARDGPALRRLDAAAAEAFDAFGAAGVNARLLKGPALARTLYTSGEHRGYSDVDLLVAPLHVPGARRVLADLGYSSLADRLGIDDVAGILDAETWVGVGETETATGGLMLDLHWRLPGARCSPEAAWEALTKERRTVELAGRRVPTLAVEGLALQLATHAAQHGRRYEQPIEDLAKGLERWSPDVWRGAARLAAEIEATEAFAAGLRQLPQGAALAGDLGLPATHGLEWGGGHGGAGQHGTFPLQAFRQARTLSERVSVLRRSLLPRAEWIAWQYPWARGTRLRMLAARVLHLVRAPLWAARAWQFRRRGRRAGEPSGGR
jgi:Uncharacterised nucleotidyltransferase